MCKTPPGDVFRRRKLPPVGLADEDDPSGAQASLQKVDGAGDSPADPGGSDTGRHADLLVRDVPGGIAVDEPDPVGDAELQSAKFRLPGEQAAHVDTCAGDAVIPCPGAQHFPGTAAEVEHTGSRFHSQRRAKSGELFDGERIVDAVSAFSDVEYSRNVHCNNLPAGGNRAGHG